jgi:hypothetical protein
MVDTAGLRTAKDGRPLFYKRYMPGFDFYIPVFLLYSVIRILYSTSHSFAVISALN